MVSPGRRGRGDAPLLIRVRSESATPRFEALVSAATTEFDGGTRLEIAGAAHGSSIPRDTKIS